MSRTRPLLRLVVAALLSLAAQARAEAPLDPGWRAAVEDAVRMRMNAGAGATGRLEIDVGKPDARLAAAPCFDVEAFIPPGARPETGRFSAGLRCASGASWTIYLPVVLRRFVPVAVATRDLPAGTPLGGADVAMQERDITRLGSGAVADASALAGRSFTRAFAAGQPLLSSALRRDPVVAPGDPVQVVVNGTGFSIRVDGVALDLAEAGQTVRIRLDNGQRVQGIARAGRTVELQL